MVLSNTCDFSTIGNGAADGKRLIAARGLSSAAQKLMLRSMAVLANRLSFPPSNHALGRAFARLCKGSGGAAARVVPQEANVFRDGLAWANGLYYVSLYDVQVALCEFSRWLKLGGTSLRMAPQQ